MSTADTARLGMARTFQNLRIYVNMTVLENVLVGCHRHERSGLWAGGLGLPRQRREEERSRERAARALAAVGLEDKAPLPAASLPYGSQRLVEIARALASEPRLLLLDEPAAGMNAAERAHLVERIRSIRDSGVTVLLVEHDIELVMGISERVYVLDYGVLIAEGRPETVRQDPGGHRGLPGSQTDGGPPISARPGSSPPALPGARRSSHHREPHHRLRLHRSAARGLVHRAQRRSGGGPGSERRRQDHAASHHLRPACGPKPVRSSTRARTSPVLLRRRSPPGASARCPKDGGFSASSRCRTTWWWAARAAKTGERV